MNKNITENWADKVEKIFANFDRFKDYQPNFQFEIKKAVQKDGSEGSARSFEVFVRFIQGKNERAMEISDRFIRDLGKDAGDVVAEFLRQTGVTAKDKGKGGWFIKTSQSSYLLNWDLGRKYLTAVREKEAFAKSTRNRPETPKAVVKRPRL